MSDNYQFGRIIDINNYGTNSVAVIDGEERDIITLTYNIIIKKDNGETLSLKSNFKDNLIKGEDIHFLYDNNNYITCVIEDPDEMWDELEENKKYLKQDKSFWGIAKNYISSVSVFMALPSFFVILINCLFSGQYYGIENLVFSFVFCWFFFTIPATLALAMLEHPLHYFTYSNAKIANNYYKYFMEGYNKKRSKLKKVKENQNEYIQEK